VSGEAGKGDKPRPRNAKRYDANWEHYQRAKRRREKKMKKDCGKG